MLTENSKYTKTDTKIINKALLKAFTLIGRKRLYEKDKIFLSTLFDSFLYHMIDQYSGMNDLIRDLQQFEDENKSCYQPSTENYLFCLPNIKNWYYTKNRNKNYEGLEYMYNEVREDDFKNKNDEKDLCELLDYLI